MNATDQDHWFKCKWTSKKVCLSHNHTQGYLLVNIFIVVFPLKFDQDKQNKNKNQKTKQNKPKTMAPEKCTICFSLQHRDPSLNGSCALGFSNKWRKKDLALLKFWGEVWVSTLVWLDRICYRSNASRLEWSSRRHGIHPPATGLSSRSWGSCPRILLPQPCHHQSPPSSWLGCHVQLRHLLCQLWVHPRHYSWSRHSQRGGGGHSWRRKQMWYHR